MVIFIVSVYMAAVSKESENVVMDADNYYIQSGDLHDINDLMN